MRGIGRRSAPIQVVVHYPTTEEGKQELADRVAGVHADFVLQYVRKLQCPSNQTEQLIDAVIESAKEKQKQEKKASDKSR